MKHIFGSEFDDKTHEILESLKTASEAAAIMLSAVQQGDRAVFNEIIDTLEVLITTVYMSAKKYQSVYSELTLTLRCQCILGSINNIHDTFDKDTENTLKEIEFELIPVIEEAYSDFYYQAYVLTYPDREKLYFEKEMYELVSNKYINESAETGVFKYDVTISVLAYNKLDYTKMCIKSLMENIPEDLNYELILWDNGSTDGTLQYFKSLRPDKLIESWVNWGMQSSWHRIIQGRYFVHVSNDVLVMKDSLKNMLECIKSDNRIGKIVPTTPNISNLQAVNAEYASIDELKLFAEKNNVYDSRRHEERVRLCDPIAVWDSVHNFSKNGTCPDGYLSSMVCFPDDKSSLLLRRKGFRQILAKDAFCHHFGSVTIKDDIAKRNEEQFYSEGRKLFQQYFNVDPWGSGFCYAMFMMEKVVDEESGHVDILGINCGFGSNSLKIKEQLNEYYGNTDCSLYNVTDSGMYISDLKGISSAAEYVRNTQILRSFLEGKSFNYIVWDTPFLVNDSFNSLMKIIISHLAEGGKLFLQLSPQSSAWYNSHKNEVKTYGNSWICYTYKNA